MLIVFEGLDNCGKTTIVEMLKDYFDHEGKPAEFTREFETNIGIVIKEMAQAGSLDTILKAYLFAADRHIRTRDYSENDYLEKNILFDRYYHSAIAYRMAEGVDKKWIINLNSVFRRPDIVFFIDITPEESVRRNTDKKFNIIQSTAYLQRVREAYLAIADEFDFVHIDGMRPIKDIFQDVLSYIKSIQ